MEKLAETNGNLALTNSTVSLAKSFLTASRRVGQGLLCRPGEAPNSEARQAFGREAKALRSSLQRSPTDGAIVTAILAQLLQSFPVQAGSEQAAAQRLEAYQVATERHPAWIVSEAFQRWLQGRSNLDDANYRFAPTPSQLALICQACAGEVWHEVDALTSAASIREEEPPTDTAEREAQMARIQAKFGEDFGLGKQSKQKAAMSAEVNERLTRANETFRQKDFAVAGMEARSPLAPSPSLLATVENVKPRQGAA